FAIATAAIAWIVAALTGSCLAAALGAAAFALNPNVLYLQATPMTELLLIALMMAAVAMLIAWCASDGAFGSSRASGVGIMFALACLTRYEAWFVTVAALAAATVACRLGGDSWRRAVRRVAAIGVYPAGAMIAFLIFSR